MSEVVIVDAVRTPVGKRNGSLAGTSTPTTCSAPCSARWSSAPVSTPA